jgi:hypothetical protein
MRPKGIIKTAIRKLGPVVLDKGSKMLGKLIKQDPRKLKGYAHEASKHFHDVRSKPRKRRKKAVKPRKKKQKGGYKVTNARGSKGIKRKQKVQDIFG